MAKGIAPDKENYTVPGGQKIFFTETGGVEKDLGNIASLDVEHTIELLEHWTNRDGSRKLDKTVPISKKLEFPFTLDEPVVDNLRYYFAGGTIANVNAGTANVVNQAMNLPGELLVSVGHKVLTAVVVTNLAGDVTYVKNTDYVLDAAEGRIGRIAAGAITDNQQVLVDYAYATYDSQKFAISTGSFIEGSARIEIKPTAGLGIQKEYQIPKCQIRPNGQVKDDDKDWEKMPFVLTVLSDYDNNPTKPYGELIIYS
jgi:hypothetical protein